MRASERTGSKKIQQGVSGSVSNWLIGFQYACMPVNESFGTDYSIAFLTQIVGSKIRHSVSSSAV